MLRDHMPRLDSPIRAKITMDPAIELGQGRTAAKSWEDQRALLSVSPHLNLALVLQAAHTVAQCWGARAAFDCAELLEGSSPLRARQAALLLDLCCRLPSFLSDPPTPAQLAPLMDDDCARLVGDHLGCFRLGTTDDVDKGTCVALCVVVCGLPRGPLIEGYAARLSQRANSPFHHDIDIHPQALLHEVHQAIAQIEQSQLTRALAAVIPDATTRRDSDGRL